MDTLTFIFAFSSSFALVMVLIRRWQLERKSTAILSEYYVPPFFRGIIFLRKKLTQWIRYFSLRFLTRILYLTAFVFDKLKKITYTIIRKMEKAMINRDVLPRKQGAASLFLKDVSQHKKRALERIRRRSVRERELHRLEE